MNKLASTLHDATHLVPGVAAHDDSNIDLHSALHADERRLRNRRHSHHHAAGPRLQGGNQRHQAPPRVFVGWQTWIGQLVNRAGKSDH